MKKVIYILTLCSLVATLISCTQTGQKDKNVSNKTTSRTEVKLALADYKIDSLKLSIGENYSVTDNIIDWHWAALDDPDDKIDSTGIDAFFYLGEPLIKFNNEQCLPSLYIETDKNLISGFKVQVEGWTLDDSVLHHLKKLTDSISTRGL